MTLLECEYCKEPIHKAITYEGSFMYHPKCYILKDKLTYPILFSSVWKIHAIKFTADKSKNKRADILLTHKESGKEFLVYNWKRHPYFHYEVREKLIDEFSFDVHSVLFFDGEIKALGICDLIGYILDKLNLKLYSIKFDHI